MESSKQIGITEVVVRDGIQSLLATRVPLRDLVSILPVLDKVGSATCEVAISASTFLGNYFLRQGMMHALGNCCQV